MWITLKQEKSETELLKESVNNLECKIAIMEAANELQNEIIECGMFNEGSNKIIEKLKSYVMKVCPSPDKLKDFFKKMGNKVDAKMQKCKSEAVRNAWNTIKKIVGIQEQVEQEIANGEGEDQNVKDGNNQTATGDQENGNQEQQGGEQGNEEAMAAESLYDDWEDYDEFDDADFEDIEDGYDDWSDYGDDEYEDEYDDEYGRWYDYAYFEATGAKKPMGKKKPMTTKKPAAKKPVKKAPAKKTPAKKTATKKAPAKKTPAKKTKKATGDNNAQMTPETKKEKIMSFLKNHWKFIVFILLIAVGIGFGMGWLVQIAMMSPAVTKAASTINNNGQKLTSGFAAGATRPTVIRYADGSVVASGDAAISTDF